jgi:hypothetical protein
MPQAGFEPTIPVTKRLRPTPWSARPPGPATNLPAYLYKEHVLVDWLIICVKGTLGPVDCVYCFTFSYHF